MGSDIWEKWVHRTEHLVDTTPKKSQKDGLKGEMWEEWALTYGRNGSIARSIWWTPHQKKAKKTD